MKKGISALLVVLFCFAFTNDVQKRIVRENGFDIECYISVKKVNTFDTNKIYYWFKSGGIHQSLENVGGNVLHNGYLKYYRSNQLAEKGNFNYGLKTGIWKSWFENGQLKYQEYWSNGYLDGDIANYDVNGNLILTGKYKNNLKVGQWINYKTKDTLYYKKDFKFEEKPKNLLQRVLRKRDSVEKHQIRTDRFIKKRNDSIKRAKSKIDKRIKKRNDSISRAKIKLNKKTKKTKDSLDRIHKKVKKTIASKETKKGDNGFFKRLFKKEAKKNKK